MPRWIVSLAVVLVTVLSLAATAASQTSAPNPAHSGSSIYALGSEGEYALIDAGSQAPDFSFETQQGWLRLHDLRTQGNVLLMISPTDDQLAALEKERPQLLTMDVVPIAVLDQRANTCRSLADRLRLGFTVAPDTRRVIGAQFNALEPSSRADAPAWFVIARNGRVRDLGHGDWPTSPWIDVCAEALGLPKADTPRPASYPR